MRSPSSSRRSIEGSPGLGKILVVEDEENQREGLAELLCTWGYDVDTAQDGLEGLRKVRSCKPDVVITDQKMPRMSGIELLEKARSADPGIGFFVVSAYGTIPDAVRSLKLGAVNFLQKPIRTTSLRRELQGYLKGRQRPLRAFLCHCSSDKARVRSLYRRLAGEGVDAWFDEKSLLPGQDWDLQIRKAVRAADVVVVCLSPASITKQGYVQKELKVALDVAEEKPEGTTFLIPVKLRECEVPERLQRWHWVNLFQRGGHIRLLRALRARAGGITLELFAHPYGAPSEY
jgi:CheY-like chemotaxis protein